jgi:hypothetical protein
MAVEFNFLIILTFILKLILMKYDPRMHHRRSIRLKGYDYSREGLYFITICVQDKLCLFGSVVNGQMIWNDPGNMIKK